MVGEPVVVNGHAEIELDVLVIGGGFGGCYLLKKLRDDGFKTKLIDAAPRLGGVWAHNRYPGARVDVEMPCYSYSDPAVLNTFTWTERYPSDKELRRYFDHVDKVWNLSKDVECNTQAVQCTYQEQQGNSRWHVEVKSGKVYNCKWLVSATGTSFKQYIPEWKNMDLYRGVIGHSSLWPANIDLANKRVAIIGAGSTALQVMQEAAKVSTNVTQYIRTPNLALPMRQRRISEEEIYAYRPIYPHLMKSLRSTPAALPTTGQGKGTFDVSDGERRKIWEEGWKRGGFNWSIGGFSDTLLNREANKEAYKFWREKTLPRMKNQKKAALLIPEEQPYWVGTKRPSLEQDYYECCDRSNVEITDAPIMEFTETGIVSKDGERPFDIVAICTGYDAVTGGLRTMGIKGRGLCTFSSMESVNLTTPRRLEPGRQVAVRGLDTSGHDGQQIPQFSNRIWQFVLDHPQLVRSGLFIGTLSKGLPTVFQERATLAEAKGMEALYEPTLTRWFLAESLEANGAEVQYVRKQLDTTKVANWATVWRALSTFDFSDRLQQVQVPALCLASKEDTSTPPSFLKTICDLVNNGTYVEIQGGTHLFPMEIPDAASEAIIRFLEIVEGYQG